jgi:manganese/iron transport system substrate-binding protein
VSSDPSHLTGLVALVLPGPVADAVARRRQGAHGWGRVGVLTCGLLLAACASATASSSSKQAEPQAEPRSGPLIVASTTVLADLVALAIGDDGEVRSLVPAGGDPHGYEPTPGDVRLLGEADLVVMNGVGLEPWLDAVIGSTGAVLRVGEVVAGDVRLRQVDGEPDPHLWMVPTLAARYVEVIAQRLDDPGQDGRGPAGAVGASMQRAAAAAVMLAALEDELEATLSVIPESQRVIVTTHDSQGYFAQRFGFRVATLVGVSTEEVPSARRQREIVDDVRAAGVPTVFLEDHVAPALMRAIARDAGVQVGGVLHGDALAESGEGPDSYVAMLRSNARVLVEGLGP